MARFNDICKLTWTFGFKTLAASVFTMIDLPSLHVSDTALWQLMEPSNPTTSQVSMLHIKNILTCPWPSQPATKYFHEHDFSPTSLQKAPAQRASAFSGESNRSTTCGRLVSDLTWLCIVGTLCSMKTSDHGHFSPPPDTSEVRWSHHYLMETIIAVVLC